MHFGKLFKELRTEKGFSKKTICDGIISVQFLGKFEQGENDISLTNIYLLLERMNVTFDEFFSRNENYLQERITAFDRELMYAYQNRNHFLLSKLSKENQERYLRDQDEMALHFHMIAGYYNQHMFPTKEKPEDHVEVIRSYLNSVESWTNYEYYLATKIMMSLSVEEVYLCFKRIEKQAAQENRRNEYKEEFLINNMTYFLKKDDPAKCEELLHFYEHFVIEQSTEIAKLIKQVYFNYIKGLVLVRKGDQSGVQLAQENIDILARIDPRSSYVNLLQLELGIHIDKISY